MIYDLENQTDRQKYKTKTAFFLANNKKVEMTGKSRSRTIEQNSALHLFFTMISDQLNEMGIDFQYQGLKGMDLSMRHTPDIVKNFVWRPIQMAMFNIESTTKIDTDQINDIIDVLTKYFGDKGIVIEFPSIDSLMNK